ncbi:F0F1 ATP synthase subunit delta [Congregibacter litoralis]|uniref:ATP synthase subunit delta n=1 Tax=Congregibacter litoralis KT71 TaxID=314285 RepID=A4A970_9GAMM|nr:F0F1 ATP synthase subunit delta [Congregibacter litoralis]EAQ97612.1 ATP synthase F1 subcomplex delta subunit [Congregibacter litoralis KT71]
MAELSTLARPYARAAFEYADSENALSEWLSELQLIAAVVSDEAVQNLLGDPSLTTEKQAETFVSLMGDELGESRKRFLHVLAENRRLGLVPNILELFAQLKAQREQSVDVEMVSPFEVPDTVRDRIAQALGKRLEREVVVSTSIDSSLLGGVLIRAGDLVIDGSVRGRLNKLAEALTN